MPSFILRDLNPEFWARVQAKAAAEGTTVKALILRLLSSWLAAVLVLAVSACGGNPTAPSVESSLPPVVTLPAPFVPPAFSLDGLTTCGRPTDNAWTLVMADAGRDGARFHTVVAHGRSAGCSKPTDEQHVDDEALLGIHGETQYAPHGTGTTTFTYAATAFTCGTAEVTITLTAADGRPIVTVADALIDYGTTCGIPPVAPLPPSPPGPTPAPLPPIVNLAASATSVSRGQTITFTADVTRLRPGETVIVYSWDLDGDGTFEFTTTTPQQTSAPYPAVGFFTANVVATTTAIDTGAGLNIQVTR